MIVVLQGVGRTQHKHHGMQVGNRFLQGDRADVEQVAQGHYCQRDQHHRECQPGHGATGQFGDGIQTIGKFLSAMQAVHCGWAACLDRCAIRLGEKIHFVKLCVSNRVSTIACRAVPAKWLECSMPSLMCVPAAHRQNQAVCAAALPATI